MIIIRTLRKDIANYNKEDDIVRGLGWGGMDWKREDELTVGRSTCTHERGKERERERMKEINLKGIEKERQKHFLITQMGRSGLSHRKKT